MHQTLVFIEIEIMIAKSADLCLATRCISLLLYDMSYTL